MGDIIVIIMVVIIILKRRKETREDRNGYDYGATIASRRIAKEGGRRGRDRVDTEQSRATKDRTEHAASNRRKPCRVAMLRGISCRHGRCWSHMRIAVAGRFYEMQKTGGCGLRPLSRGISSVGACSVWAYDV